PVAPRQIMGAANDIPDRPKQSQPQCLGMAERCLQRVIVVQRDDLMRLGRRAELNQHMLLLGVQRQRALELCGSETMGDRRWTIVIRTIVCRPSSIVRRLADPLAQELERLGSLAWQDHPAVAAIRETVELRAQLRRAGYAGAPEQPCRIFAQRLGQGLLAPGIGARETCHQPTRRPWIAKKLQQRFGLELGPPPADHALVIGDRVADRGGVAVVLDLVWVQYTLAIAGAGGLFEISRFESHCQPL